MTSVPLTSTADPLSQNPFLTRLAATFNVTSIPLAIFLLILVCLLCICALVFIILCIRSGIRRVYLTRIKKKRLKSIYLDELDIIGSKTSEYGQLSYMFMYELPTNALTVVIGEAKNLPFTSDQTAFDAYASLKLIREKQGRSEQVGKTQKTSIIRHTDCPRWHHSCTFQIPQSELSSIKLVFDIYDYDSIGQDRNLGRLIVPLDPISMDEYTGGFYEDTGPLQPGEAKFAGLGQVCIGLTYQSKLELLEVYIYEARKLTVKKFVSQEKNHQLDIHVELRVKRRLLGSFETSSKTELVNPYFNEKAQFQLRKKYLDRAVLICSLRKRGRLGRKEAIAFLRIGPTSEQNDGVKHWEEMTRISPRTHVMWHTWLSKLPKTKK
ncbi:hypothetical protein EG68_00273 [Paragonimus skrjabini miyazakii]|uniref:C2 domain-containing protein n=1 Tax=Paragonimus skrjabini miyazakii TaxID=59628 RepID=A0A8S9ZAQ2_9TREM|nr:hypothetical protein EG68_00273 [Paragonimus skrjabini miyazakii]